MMLAASLLLSIALYGALVYCYGQRMSNDGDVYLRMAEGKRVSRPFSWRWLMPKLCGASHMRWAIASGLSWIAMGPVGYLYFTGCGLESAKALTAVACMLTLSGIAVEVALPILQDATAMALALGSAACAMRGHMAASIALAALSGGFKEVSPIFAAAFAWSPWPLLGLLGSAASIMLSKTAPSISENAKHPFRTGHKKHANLWFDPLVMLLPWGIGLLALCKPSMQLGLVAALAYSMLLIATDSARLYQWAAPVVMVAAVQVIPDSLLIPAVAAHVFNPWKGNGI